MKKQLYILVLSLLSLSAAVMSPVSAEPPIDDAYYWPGTEYESVPFPPADSEAQPIDTIPAEPATSIEYTNVQDTTVTIVIKR